jgi:hypothetical protein
VETKKWYESRTIWSVVVALLSVFAAVLGIDATVIEDVEAIPDGGVTIMEILAVVSTVAAGYFRKAATKSIA